ncbi:Flp family type IVb pilin [Vibrio nereis]|uniref:Flp family type IVb pilin n=1 Tax=Vibrio nereis TaxID=693 RepID=UPI002494A5A0|nr:Flp family type IVb pilin [Vibrio nereis]
MDKFTKVAKEFWNDEEGLTAVEYAVAGSLIAAAVVVAFQTLGTTVTGVINDIITALGGTPA